MYIDDLPLACSYWLQQKIEAIIPEINDKLTGMYSSASDPALVKAAVTVGELTNADTPTICVWTEKGSQPNQLDMNGFSPESKVDLLYKIKLCLPEASDDNTVSDFELTKQCAMGKLWRFFWDTRNTMAPVVYTKADPEIQVTAIASRRRVGDWRSVFSKPLSDTQTLTRSVEMTFTFSFGICEDTVLDSASAS